jgi:DNA-directed RNA polymerase subunit RPC12/RpoP
MATKMPVAQKRMFENVFICKKCSKKIRSQPTRIIAGKVKCPRCDSRTFRTVKKK